MQTPYKLMFGLSVLVGDDAAWKAPDSEEMINSALPLNALL